MPNWTDAQLDAIKARRGTVLVSAAAGSGKTAVLVERVIERLTDPEHPTDADRLLVVTFTKAAAAEMRDRMRTLTTQTSLTPLPMLERGPQIAPAAVGASPAPAALVAPPAP